jgi:photosystem II stability/assembly factor-like uncharacterized protein
MKNITKSIVVMCLCFGMSVESKGQNQSSPEFRAKSWQHHLELKKISPYKDLKWRTVGPEFMSGRIETIAGHPDQPNTLYVGAGSGNLWKTVNNGTTWKPIFDDQSTAAMGCIAIAPSDPAILWLGTGEVLMARSSFAGTGVFKSIDAGETWQHMGLMGTNHIPRIVIDPKNPEVVYAASIGRNYGPNKERGVYKTINGGKTWDKILFISENVGVVEIVMDPSDNQTLLAVAWERERKAWNNKVNGKGSGIYKTTDGGKKWKQIKKGIPKGNHVGRFGLSFSQSNPNIVYAIVDNRSEKPEGTKQPKFEGKRLKHRGDIIRGELYKSVDKGETWLKTHEGSIPTGIGDDFCLIRVAPDNENEIFILGQKLIKTRDGGKSFEPTGETIVHLLSHDIRVMHLDMHEMWIDPTNPDKIVLGNDGGVYISYDRGDTWLHHNNLPIGEFYAVSVDNAVPYNIYGGTQDDAALYGPSSHNVEDRLTKFGVEDPWKHVYVDRWGGGDSYFTEVDKLDPNIIYYEHQFGAIRRKNMLTGETKSIKPAALEGGPPLRTNWMTPFFISKYNKLTLYYGAQKLYRSKNRGDDWEVISPDLTTNPGSEKQGNVPYGTITSLSESSLMQGLMYAATDDGNVQVTKDEGRTWTLIDNGLPEKWVSRVKASQHDKETVYVTLTGYREDDFEKYVFMSTDYGETWKSIDGNLPSEPINVIVEDPRSPNILYVGTDLGAYVTTDKGQNWSILSNGLPTVAVHDLVIQERELDLVAGTHGRSIFVLDIEAVGK